MLPGDVPGDALATRAMSSLGRAASHRFGFFREHCARAAGEPYCGTSELLGRHRKSLLHRDLGTRYLMSFIKGVEFFGKRADRALARFHEAAVLVDRDEHRERLVVLGNGDPAFTRDTIE